MFLGALVMVTAAANLADWGNIWVYLVGPAVGVVLAWLVHPLLAPPTTTRAER